MASFTITGGTQFPETTVVGAYLRTQFPTEGVKGAPSGAAVATATVTGGTATFTGLADGTRYVAYAQVGGIDRYDRFSTDAASVGTTATGVAIVDASANAGGAADAGAINAALEAARLAGGGVVRGIAGRTYYINARLVVGSFVTLDMTGCTIVQVDNTNRRITTNYSWMNPVGTAADASITAAASVITSVTLAPLAAVGMSITVTGAAGPAGAPVPLCGLVSAVNTGASQITVTNLDATTLVAANTVTNASASLFNRDTKPRVIGGIWQRGSNNHSGGGSDQSVHSYHHCDYPYVHPESVTSTLGSDSGHCIDFGDVTRAFGQIDHCDYQGVAVQINGPAYGVTIPRIVGKTFDDAFAITASDWASNGIDVSGNVVGVRVGEIDVTSGVRLVNIVAGVGNLVDDIKVEKVRGTGGNAIGAVCIGDDTASTSTVGGTYGTIEIRGISARPKASSRCVNLISPSFKKIKLELAYSPWTYSTLKTFVELTGTSSVFPQHLEITGYAELAAGQSNVNVFSHNSTASQVDRLNIHDLNFNGNNVGGWAIVNQAASTVLNRCDLVSNRINGNQFTSYYVNLAATTTLKNLNIIGGHAWKLSQVINDLGAGAREIYIGGGFEANTPVNVALFTTTAGSTKTITLGGCLLDSVSGSAFNTTNAPLTFRGDQMSTSGTFTMLTRAGTEVVTSRGPQLPFDVTALSRSGVGDMCNNTNAGAACGVGVVVSSGSGAAGSWKNVFSGATY